jgi:hypothetical protein
LTAESSEEREGEGKMGDEKVYRFGFATESSEGRERGGRGTRILKRS